MQRLRVRITGIVQGVGFRPYLFQLAREFAVTGFVYNDPEGVWLEVQGNQASIMVDDIPRRIPSNARIDRMGVEPIAPVQGETVFSIIEGQPSGKPGSGSRTSLVTPDLMLCEECRQELHNPANRRYLYPFLNCTACGPRFTIVRTVPYDRVNTSLAAFPLCEDCAAEYRNPGDRRFHAEPIACHVCGPRLYLAYERPPEGLTAFFARGRAEARDAAKEKGIGPKNPGLSTAPSAIPSTAAEHTDATLENLQARVQMILREGTRLILEGKTLAVKGIGGWHLACDATNETAVGRLRERKARDEKPFAVMFADLPMIRAAGLQVSESEAALLASAQAPIVLLSPIRLEVTEKPQEPDDRMARVQLAPSIAPEGLFVGAMLPCTPLHDLLLQSAGRPLVMTSGNRSGNPTAYTDEGAFEDLTGIADAFLLHDREILSRCDDSVVRLDETGPVFYRRSRGYAPDSLASVVAFRGTVFGAGAFLNNTFAFGSGMRVIPAHHVGDLDHPSTIQAYREGLHHYEKLFDLRADCFVADLHPDYPSTNIAEEEAHRRGVPFVQVQHHEAHIASCLAENGHFGPALGLALDGTGYGRDGTIWGGELFLTESCLSSPMERIGGLMPIPMPGGDAAVREPWRMSLSLLAHGLGFPDSNRIGRELEGLGSIAEIPDRLLRATLDRLGQSVTTSGCGRMFDAVSFLTGAGVRASFEGQPAIRLEGILPPQGEVFADSWYEWDLRNNGRWVLDPAPMARMLLRDLRYGISGSEISWRFHEGLVRALLALVDQGRKGRFANTIALSGGCLFNCYLSQGLDRGLRSRGLHVLHHRRVPPGDGGIALGQLFLSGRGELQDPGK